MDLKKLKREIWYAVVTREELQKPPGSRAGINPYRTLVYCLTGDPDRTMSTFPGNAYWCAYAGCDTFWPVHADVTRDLSDAQQAQRDRVLIRPDTRWANIGNTGATKSMQRMIEQFFRQGGEGIPRGSTVADCPTCGRHPDQARPLAQIKTQGGHPVNHQLGNGTYQKEIIQYNWEGALYELDDHSRLYWRDPQLGPNNADQLLMYDSNLPARRRGYNNYSVTCDGPVIGGIPEIRPANLAANAPNNVKVHDRWCQNPIIFYRCIAIPGNGTQANNIRTEVRQRAIAKRAPGAQTLRPPRRPAPPANAPAGWQPPPRGGHFDRIIGVNFRPRIPGYHGLAGHKGKRRGVNRRNSRQIVKP
jgi:hypothetical protein